MKAKTKPGAAVGSRYAVIEDNLTDSGELLAVSTAPNVSQVRQKLSPVTAVVRGHFTGRGGGGGQRGMIR